MASAVKRVGAFFVTAGGVEHETEHTGPLARAVPRKRWVPARTKLPTTRPCAPPVVGGSGIMNRSGPRSAALFVAGGAQRGIVNKFGSLAMFAAIRRASSAGHDPGVHPRPAL